MKASRRAAASRLCLSAIFCVALCRCFAPAAVFAAEPPPPIFNWAGLYIGASLGAGVSLNGGERLQAGSGFTSFAFDLYPASNSRTGVTAGAQAGYNWQSGPWVWGVETDFSLLDGRRGPNGLFIASPAYPALPFFTLTPHSSANYFATIRGRAGVAIDRALIYLTGGVASGGARGPETLAVNGAVFSATWSQSSRMKYALGAGFEYAFAHDWSARAEYLFLSQSLNTQIFDDGAGSTYFSRIRNENHVLRFGLNYHFGEANEIPGAIQYGQNGRRGHGDGEDKEEQYSVHAQTTNVVQAYPKFRAAYDGPNSFPSGGLANVGSTSNLFAGLRLWEGGAVYLNPEIDIGYGVADSVGAASYVDGAVAKVGRTAPYMRFQRYFLRQVIGLDGGEKGRDPDEGSRSEVLESVQNQISGAVDKDRLIITLGKFAVGDVFDDNVYAHDPTTGFLNFAFNTLGNFDYAADSWGYTYGLATEWKQSWWTVRGGVFQLSTVPNGLDIEPQLFRQFMGVGEIEARYELLGQPGAIKFLGFGDNGYLSKVGDDINFAFITGQFPPTYDAARKRSVKVGGGINVKQQLMPHLGFFLRAGMSDGRYETVDYTDIDRTVSFGLVGGGALWGREDDEIGLAAAFSGLHGDRVRYFGLGGVSVYIGDGALAYGGEKNMEAYYKLGFGKNMDATFDYQLLVNPAHNAARGPVNVFALRLRAAF
ncbi:carbohydrate porin [Methylocystis parvus]|uniref:Outer membrane beta-barrel protein n=1 Tax=Methylocystis parvus TaxID=134 RepID=A0A6B8M4T0_9HYPH|nr:carbohydrate porin [Methylocystis parvus]QGM97345.1 outer membrane beta-barrel protein [Methylocystis parvus]WBJ98745.1 carbohydrate porin [Methylocystis parvus OBBP]